MSWRWLLDNPQILFVIAGANGTANSLAPLWLAGTPAREAVNNVTEWWGALIFVLFFFALAAIWRRARFEWCVAR